MRHLPIALYGACMLAFVLSVNTLQAGCAKAPPTLGPTASVDFQKTRIIKALDVFRDFAIDGEAAKPQAVSTALTKKIVTYHQSALHIIDAAGTTWKSLVGSGLDEFVATLSQADQSKVRPYVGLIKALIAEVN